MNGFLSHADFERKICSQQQKEKLPRTTINFDDEGKECKCPSFLKTKSYYNLKEIPKNTEADKLCLCQSISSESWNEDKQPTSLLCETESPDKVDVINNPKR